MLFLNSQSEYLFISSSLGPALNSNFKEELFLQIDKQIKQFFLMLFHQQLMFIDFSECFIINENNTLRKKSDMMRQG